MSSPSAPTSFPSGPAPAARRAYIDWARGLAVLLMIEAHTLDAWTRLDVRNTHGFRNATILGGFAAPLFLWLAGVGVALAAARGARREGRTAAGVEAVVRRGLEIYILAFLFRVQGFAVTPGGPLLTIFRVDVLNVMGPSIVAAALVWGAARSTRGRLVALGACTVAIAMVTPIVRAAAAVDLLPVFWQWHLRPAGEQTTFTLLPWAGFVFAGAAVGVLIDTARDARSERLVAVGVGAAGLALIAAGFVTAARPSIYASSSFWTSSPTWFAIRVGVLMTGLAGLFAARPFLRGAAWLERLGRSSLFIYWIHVELVYGYASWLWRHRLPLWGTAVGFVAFCTLMYGAVVLRDDVVTRRRRGSRALTQPATA